MLIGVLLGLVLIVVVIAIVLLSHYCSVTSIEHLQEICRTVAALREAAMAFPGRVENNDWWEGDNPSQLTPTGVEMAYSVFITGFGPLHVISFSLNRGKWPRKRRIAGHIFGVIEQHLVLRDLSRGWANPIAHLYYLVYQETDRAIHRNLLTEVPTGPCIGQIKRVGLTAPTEANVIYLAPGDYASSGKQSNDVIRKALGVV